MAHLSPDTPAVDVAVTPLGGGAGVASFPGLHYGDVSAYERLPAGHYAVAVRAAGAGSGTAPVLSLAVDLADGTARTVMLDSRFAGLRLDSVPDDLSPPPAGSARVRVVDAAAGSPSVDLSFADGPPLASRLSFPHMSAAVIVPAGARSLRLSARGSTTAVPLDVPAGAVVTLLVLDQPGGGPVVRPVTDAVGPADVPVGPVDAGGGGTAPSGLCRSVLACLFSATAASTPPAPPRATALAAAPTAVPGPTRLVVPAAGIDAPLAAIAPDASGALAAPADPGTAGWLQSGPAPGAVGPAVVAGHVDTVHAPAVFFSLRRLAPGDPVDVVRGDGSTVRFIVDRVERIPKAAFPTAEVYGPTPDPELRLITCGGAFDRAARSYVDNVVVYARLAG